MIRNDDNDNGTIPPPSPEPPLPEEDDSNLGDDFTKAGEGKDLTNAQQ
ncbi:MAG: hypothetical protein PHX87_02785 [Candidatus Peribacteraceae bacterium]|nr:hypothetical protein [Candidatus Peribacteraceae bacterium]MDD5742334.1 hypothetical protein [Candidatus Peribacteraceae bacterium]